MKKAILLPRKFVLGRGVIDEVGEHAAILGKKTVVVWGPRTREAVGERVLASLRNAGVEAVESGFGGKATRAEAERIARVAAAGAELVIGVGGGTAVDTAKAAAISVGLPHMIVPTVASNDAPTSACTVWYDEDGVCTGFDLWAANPDYVLVDTEVIAAAPKRYFVAGIGDAFATWFEADACLQSRALTCSGGVATMTAMGMARLCRDTIMNYGLAAVADVEVGAVTPAVEMVTEATTLLSGIGWESGGLATAHAIGNGLPALPETHHLLHGEKVAFGIVTQLCLDEKMDPSLAATSVELIARFGLPVTLAELGLADISEERLTAFAGSLAEAGSFVHNHPFAVTAADLRDALVSADALGRRTRDSLGLGPAD